MDDGSAQQQESGTDDSEQEELHEVADKPVEGGGGGGGGEVNKFFQQHERRWARTISHPARRCALCFDTLQPGSEEQHQSRSPPLEILTLGPSSLQDSS
jgi:hypothetical protein